MLKRFLPRIFVDTVYDIDLVQMKNEGVKAFIFDIDNTIATYAMPLPDEKSRKWLGELADMGFKLYFVSNNNVERVRKFAESVDIPYIGKALKPMKRNLKRACLDMGVLPSETALVGDQLFTDMWGGNRMKMLTVLVEPISQAEDSFVKFKRNFEKWVLKNYSKE